MRILVVFAVLALIVAPLSLANAQTYQSWQNPDDTSSSSGADSARLDALIEKLNKLIDQAEKDKAANPMFLKDLRALANGAEMPWKKQVLLDDFADGDFTRNPVWSIGMGRYWIEKGWGLRNGLDQVKSSSSSTSNDAAAQIFGQILNQALGGSSSGASSSGGGIQPTSIFSEATISNAFSIEVDISSWVDTGEFIMGPYQGNDREAGYRLSYTVGEGLALRIKSRSGSRTVAIEPGPIKLEDKKTHKILWTRSADGTMRASIDGKETLNVKDVSFRDPFIGFGMATRGGDFIVKRVSILGTP